MYTYVAQRTLALIPICRRPALLFELKHHVMCKELQSVQTLSESPISVEEVSLYIRKSYFERNSHLAYFRVQQKIHV